MKRRTTFTTLILLILTALAMPARPVFAATLTADNADELITAITTANNDLAADTILLTDDITLTHATETSATFGNTGLTPVTTPITIEGQGHTINRGPGTDSPNPIRIFRVASGASLTLNNLTVSAGDVSNANSCSTTLPNCGGGVLNQGTLTVIHTRFDSNKAVRGGAIYNSGGALTITDSTFTTNAVPDGTSQQGGAVFTDAGTVNITDSVFTGNSSGSLGGAIFSIHTTVNISGSTFSNNSANNNGGATAGSVNISSSTFSGNTANFGGAVYVAFEVGTINSSTFSGNTANNSGGAIYFADSGAVTLNVSGSTFSGNSALISGGGIFANTRPVAVRDSIITNSTGGNCGTIATGAVNGDAFSLTDDNTGCTGFINSASINLGALANNGGATQTFALNTGSTAIDSGSLVCPGADQRGVTRGIDGVGGIGLPQAGDCDVGAFEFGATMRTLQFAVSTSSVPLGLTNIVPVVVSLDSALAGANAIRAYVWVSGGSAVAGTDFVPFGVQTVTINPGQISATATITLLNPLTEKTIVLSFATPNGPGFNGAAQLGTRLTHTVTLKVSAPNAAPNRNFYSTDTPTLTWTPISIATGYEIQVDTDTAFTAPYSFTNTSIPVGQLSVTTTHLDNGTYYWRVRAKGGTGAWSAPQTIEVFDLS